jgi:hypothetical protein
MKDFMEQFSPENILDSKGSKWIITKRKKTREIDAGENPIYRNIHKLPINFIEYLKAYESIHNASDTAWFLMLEDYCGESDSAFAWNEFQVQSLDSALDEADKEKIRDFWNSKLPFLMSVKSGYAYAALDLSETGFGSIVVGQEPEYEVVEKIADSFDDFLSMLKAHISGTDELEFLDILL